MPINKINESTELEFGNGDIEVMPGLLEDDFSTGALCFLRKKESTPIGTRTNYTPNKVAEIEETPVRMVFHKTESIDVIIRSLQEVKQFMIDKNIESTEQPSNAGAE